MAKDDVSIRIGASFVGKNAFKQAENATDRLGKQAKKLAGSLGLAFGGQAILAYGKKAVQAAAADEKAQKQLALALKNVGLGRDAAASEDYIQKLQSEFGIVDDKLRPAYQTLAVATKDTALSQKLLNLSLDISASTGKDLGTVTSALSKAYLGNNTALSKLGVGISKADLKAGKFEDIISQLETTFAGSATAAANTFQGSIDKLGVASANASEIIGTGLIDALKGLGDENSVEDLAKSMEDAALYTADVIRGIGKLIEKLKGLPGVGSLDIGMIPIIGSYLEILRKSGAAASQGGFPQGPPAEYQAAADARARAEALAAEEKARKAAAAAAAKLAALQKKSLKAQQDALKLGKAKSIFDLQKIQIEAALKGKISEEDRIRLLLMKAIEEENIDKIVKYQKLLDQAKKDTIALTNALNGIRPMDDVFKNWNFASVQQQLAALEGYFSSFKGTAASAFAALGAAQKAALGGYEPFVGSLVPSAVPTGGLPSGVGMGGNGTGSQVPSGISITVNNAGSVIAENDLAQTINDAVAASGWAGSAIGYSRQAATIAV
jgi:hypothetical protein